MMNKNIAVIILAAGKGERMMSSTPKVLHPLCGRPMLEYVLDLAQGVKAAKTIVVLGHKHQEVKKFLKPGIKAVIQKKLQGTADAIKTALPHLAGFKGTVLVLYADIPLLKNETIKKLIKHQVENKLDAVLLTASLKEPAGYGRILRDKYSSICGIVEEKDADDYEKEIKEINTGIICFSQDKLKTALKLVRPANRKKEYYLTDTIAILYKNNCLIEDIRLSDFNEAMGINSQADLAKANRIMQARINEKLMKQGVSIVDPTSTFISYGAKIGKDTLIYPFTVIEKGVKIGKRCSIGPFAHLREAVELKDDVVAGNFLEITRSMLGAGTFAKHFCYIGDSRIGRAVNIGAGTVTANFSGNKKSTTIIKDRASIGSDTVLIAPVTVGSGAVTGAGAVVVKDVPNKSIVVGVPAKPLQHKKSRKNG